MCLIRDTNESNRLFLTIFQYTREIFHLVLSFQKSNKQQQMLNNLGINFGSRALLGGLPSLPCTRISVFCVFQNGKDILIYAIRIVSTSSDLSAKCALVCVLVPFFPLTETFNIFTKIMSVKRERDRVRIDSLKF